MENFTNYYKDLYPVGVSKNNKGFKQLIVLQVLLINLR